MIAVCPVEDLIPGRCPVNLYHILILSANVPIARDGECRRIRLLKSRGERNLTAKVRPTGPVVRNLIIIVAGKTESEFIQLLRRDDPGAIGDYLHLMIVNLEYIRARHIRPATNSRRI